MTAVKTSSDVKIANVDDVIEADDDGDDLYVDKAKLRDAFDLIVNTTSRDAEDALSDYCSPDGGRIATLVHGRPEAFKDRGLFMTFFARLWNAIATDFREFDMNDAAALDALKTLTPLGPERVFPLDQAEIAFRFLLNNKSSKSGKVALRMDAFRKVCPVGEHAACD